MTLQLVVTYVDHTTMYYPIGPGRGWRIDNPSRCLVVGRGIPRTYVPLDQVRSFSIDKTIPEPDTSRGVTVEDAPW